MSRALERCIRRFVAEGSGLSNRDTRTPLGDGPAALADDSTPENQYVIPGNSRGSRPNGPYASLLLLDDQRVGYPVLRDLDNGVTAELVYRRAMFSLQFYRDGAVDYARRFDLFAMSRNGLVYAETAFADGQVRGVRVYSGGSGYTGTPTVRFVGDGSGAAGTARVSNGAVTGVVVTNRGQDYTAQPRIMLDGGSPSEPAVATAHGFGFRVRWPLAIRRLDVPEADELEERAQIQLGIDYATFSHQQTGYLDVVSGSICTDTAREEISVSP